MCISWFPMWCACRVLAIACVPCFFSVAVCIWCTICFLQSFSLCVLCSCSCMLVFRSVLLVVAFVISYLCECSVSLSLVCWPFSCFGYLCALSFLVTVLLCYQQMPLSSFWCMCVVCVPLLSQLSVFRSRLSLFRCVRLVSLSLAHVLCCLYVVLFSFVCVLSLS